MKPDPPPTRAWVTGAGGLLGHCLVHSASRHAPGLSVIGLARADLDLTDHAAVAARFRIDKPGLVLHCAALSRSPECQAHPEPARKINVEAAVHLAGLARDIEFIFLSSDQVFDGRKGAYVETDTMHPLGAYGATKAAAEEIIVKNPKHAIVRLSLCGGASPKGVSAFNEELQAAWRAGKAPRLFSDEFRSPIAAPVAARALWELAAARRSGIYHLGGAQRLSRFEIGRLVASRHPELSPRLESTSLREFQGAPRPPDVSLDCRKLQALLSFPLPGLAQWLAENPEAPF